MPCSAEKTVQLAYGRGRLEVNVPSNAKVIEPRFIPGLSDEKNAVADALPHPIQSRPLAEWIKPDSKICVLFNHEPENPAALAQVGMTRTGRPALINKHVVEADVRIATGFIEPHFFAGFSGGPKGIMPGVAGLETVMSNHGAAHIADPCATFGITVGNPIWEEMRDIALRPGPSFLLNVALNEQRQITGVFAGDLIAAHRAGCEF